MSAFDGDYSDSSLAIAEDPWETGPSAEDLLEIESEPPLFDPEEYEITSNGSDDFQDLVPGATYPDEYDDE